MGQTHKDTPDDKMSDSFRSPRQQQDRWTYGRGAPPPDFLGPMRISGANLRLISAEWKWQRGCSEPPVVNGTLPFLL